MYVQPKQKCIAQASRHLSVFIIFDNLYYSCSSWKNDARFFRHSRSALDSAAFCEIQCFYGHSTKKTGYGNELLW